MPSRKVCLVAGALLLACTPAAVTSPAPPPPALDHPIGVTEPEDSFTQVDPVADLQARLRQFAVAELIANVDALPESERKALDELIAAAELLDPIFDRQAWAGNPQLAEALSSATDELGKLRYAYFRVMRGPWDRQANFEPFATDLPRPPGAGFYPPDLTADELRAWIEAHPQDRRELESLFTIVERRGDALVARRYSEVYAQWLEPAAEHLRKAAALTRNASLRRFLNARADAFATDDYYASDKAWMDVDSIVEITIGPYETYEDGLMGLKASFEAFVTVADPAASERLARIVRYLPAMEQNLPVDDAVKTRRGAESPIRVADVVFTSGDARKSVQTIAFNLPNDERVRKEKGAKKVLLRNLIETKFDLVMKPIATRILVETLHPHLSSEAFFDQVLFHELSHSLGPAYTRRDGKEAEVRMALGASYSPLEECKADVMGAYNILFMIDKKELPKARREDLLTSYFAGLFRSVRFGVAEAHGQGAAVQINRFLEEGAATFDERTRRFALDFDALEKSIESLVADLVMLQHVGDKDAADAFLARYGVMSPPMEAALAGLQDVPVDIRPVYPLAGERMP